MIRKFLVLAVAVGVAACASQASAKSINQIISEFTSANGGTTLTTFEDNDRTYVIDTSVTGGPDGLLGVGDIIRAMVDIQQVVDVLGAGANQTALVDYGQISAVLDGVITGKQANAIGGFTFTLGPDPAFGTYLGDPAGAAYGGGAMLAIFEDPPGAGVVPATAADLAGTAANTELSMLTVSDTSLWALFGFTGGAGEFYTIDTGASVGDSLALAAGSPLQGLGASFAAVASGMNLVAGASGVVLTLVPSTGTDLAITSQLYGSNSNWPGAYNAAYGVWPVSSDADVTINAMVPLPLAAYPGLVLLGALGVIRTRRSR